MRSAEEFAANVKRQPPMPILRSARWRRHHGSWSPRTRCHRRTRRSSNTNGDCSSSSSSASINSNYISTCWGRHRAAARLHCNRLEAQAAMHQRASAVQRSPQKREGRRLPHQREAAAV
uniref:Uncharacterized protein n=1 Tax=Prymnesium polylepis TaxID=72548 RepID=A0A7S4N266_9EUKA|mmetsp:Transcript_43679/g.120844  ORF Transcript_43679/g.120844 Transcript_43679/m.120844 type:complete len:119 (+) Transcript_43679:342-698(+)